MSREEEIKTVDSSCHGCKYLAYLGGGGGPWCDYIGEHNRPRPCPAGKGCTVRETGAHDSAKALSLKGL